MENQTAKNMFNSLLILVLLSFASLATCQEVEDEREFSYVEDSETGPSRWGEIHPEWSACGNGRMQSPIDLLHHRVQVVSDLGRLRRNYRPANATLVNRGHDIMMRWEGGAGNITINGTNYQLNQCHWHSPSEHTINGKRYDLEVHLVHESLDGRVAVVGIVYEIGHPDFFLSAIRNQLRAVADEEEEERNLGIINPRLIEYGSRKYYNYIGSLTVPPCTENVVWAIITKVRTVTREQVQLFREAVHDDSETNARPVQPLNDRNVKLYNPNIHKH